MDQGSNLHEIERKWVVPQDLFNKILTERRSSIVTAKTIEQAYLVVNDTGENKYESRVRSTSNHNDDEPYKFQHDTKIGSGVKRLEITHEISREEFKKLRSHCKTSLKKFYLKLLINGYIVEMSEVDRGEFYYMEVEFPSIQKAKNFDLLQLEDDMIEEYVLDGSIYEVTEDPSWSMSSKYLQKVGRMREVEYNGM
jgi:hypothetical protein